MRSTGCFPVSKLFRLPIILMIICLAISTTSDSESDVINESSGCQNRNWPYPLLPGNFENLKAALSEANAARRENSKEQHQRKFSFRGTQRRKQDPGLVAAVYDDVLSVQNLIILQAYLPIASDWRFTNVLRSDVGPEPLPWTATFNARSFRQSRVNAAFQALVADVQQDEKSYQPYDVSGHVMRRGDFVGIVPANPEGDEITLLYFLKDQWHVNGYGELLLYEDEEVLAAVKPALNRAVVWNSSLAYHIKSPSFNYKGSMYFMVVKYTTNISKVETYRQQWLQHRENKRQAETKVFHSLEKMNDYYKDLNVGDHHIKDYTDSDGRKIHLFDGLFEEEDLSKLAQLFETYGDYYFDDSYDEDSDNVNWISSAQIDAFVQTRIWKVIQKVASFVSGLSNWFPYDIACNNIRACDSTQMHQDCEEWEEEWTFLLYLTKNLTPSCGGETAFYDMADGNNYITSVRPVYGRAVIFDGQIPHSARPPSPFYRGPRFSFAVKVSISPWLAWSKTAKQEFAHEEFLHAMGLSPLVKFYKEQIDRLAWDDDALRDALSEILGGEEDESSMTCEKEGHCTGSFAPKRYQEANEDMAELLSGLLQRFGVHGHNNDDGDDEVSIEAGDIEESFINLKEFPEVMLRKLFLYRSVLQAGRDAEAIKGVFKQFMSDRAEMKRRYIELLEVIL